MWERERVKGVEVMMEMMRNRLLDKWEFMDIRYKVISTYLYTMLSTRSRSASLKADVFHAKNFIYSSSIRKTSSMLSAK